MYCCAQKGCKAQLLLQHQIAKHAGCIKHNCAVCSHLSVDTYSTVSLLPPSLLQLVLLRATRLIHCLLLTQSSFLPLDVCVLLRKIMAVLSLWGSSTPMLNSDGDWRCQTSSCRNSEECAFEPKWRKFLGGGKCDTAALIRELKHLAHAGICACMCKVFSFFFFPSFLKHADALQCCKYYFFSEVNVERECGEVRMPPWRKKFLIIFGIFEFILFFPKRQRLFVWYVIHAKWDITSRSSDSFQASPKRFVSASFFLFFFSPSLSCLRHATPATFW